MHRYNFIDFIFIILNCIMKIQKQLFVILMLIALMFVACVKDVVTPNSSTQIQSNQPLQQDLTTEITGIYEGFNVIFGIPDSSGTHAENIQIIKVSNDSVLIVGDHIKLIKEVDGLSFAFQSQKIGSGKYFFATKTISFKYLLPVKVTTSQGDIDCTKDYRYDGTKK